MYDYRNYFCAFIDFEKKLMTRQLIAYNRTGLYNVDGNVKRSSRMISNVFRV